MTTRKELFIIKYSELYNNLTKIINTDFFPDINTVDFLDLIFLLNFTFKDTNQTNFKKTIDDLLEIYSIKSDDIELHKVYPLLFDFNNLIKYNYIIIIYICLKKNNFYILIQ